MYAKGPVNAGYFDGNVHAARLEITHVEYREVYNGPGNLEKEIHWWIKNTGTIDASYAIHMATIRD